MWRFRLTVDDAPPLDPTANKKRVILVSDDALAAGHLAEGLLSGECIFRAVLGAANAPGVSLLVVVLPARTQAEIVEAAVVRDESSTLPQRAA